MLGVSIGQGAGLKPIHRGPLAVFQRGLSPPELVLRRAKHAKKEGCQGCIVLRDAWMFLSALRRQSPSTPRHNPAATIFASIGQDGKICVGGTGLSVQPLYGMLPF